MFSKQQILWSITGHNINLMDHKLNWIEMKKYVSAANIVKVNINIYGNMYWFMESKGFSVVTTMKSFWKLLI